MKPSSVHKAAVVSAFWAATFTCPADAADIYSISSQSTSYNVPSGWPRVPIAFASQLGIGPFPGKGIDYKAGTPVLICSTAPHFQWDSTSCGDPDNPSKAYGIGNSKPAFAIGVMIPIQEYGAFASVLLMYGDSSCQEFSNSSMPTRRWAYQIPRPDAFAGAYSFAANVGFQKNSSGQYYAVLTNCTLTNSAPSGSPR